MSKVEEVETSDLSVYFKDCLDLFEKSKSNNLPSFLHTYFTNINNKENVLFRDFNYIVSTLRNKQSFIYQFRNIFNNYMQKNLKISGNEFHQLICLLCPDFPIKIIELVLMLHAKNNKILDEKMNNIKLNILDLYKLTFNIVLYYNIITEILTEYFNNTTNNKLLLINKLNEYKNNKQNKKYISQNMIDNLIEKIKLLEENISLNNVLYIIIKLPLLYNKILN